MYFSYASWVDWALNNNYLSIMGSVADIFFLSFCLVCSPRAGRASPHDQQELPPRDEDERAADADGPPREHAGTRGGRLQGHEGRRLARLQELHHQ